MKGKKGRYYVKEEHTNYEVNKRRGTKLISNLFWGWNGVLFIFLGT
jgi:hypothetical protein